MSFSDHCTLSLDMYGVVPTTWLSMLTVAPAGSVVTVSGRLVELQPCQNIMATTPNISASRRRHQMVRAGLLSGVTGVNIVGGFMIFFIGLPSFRRFRNELQNL